MTVKNFVEIICPLCSRFLACVKPKSDVYCSRCQQYIYIGIKDDQAGAST